MLKVVKLLKLYVENFRGIKNFVLTPDGRSATVQGGNGTGKSTLMAAFLWLLTGKDAQGRENYNVFPLGTDGNRLSGCSPTVTATLSMPDGHTLVLQRSMRLIMRRRAITGRVVLPQLKQKLRMSRYMGTPFIL